MAHRSKRWSLLSGRSAFNDEASRFRLVALDIELRDDPAYRSDQRSLQRISGERSERAGPYAQSCPLARPCEYPDARQVTGADAYGRDSASVLARVGGRIVWRGMFELMLIGPVK
jgi:hypothetical protein